MAESSSDCASLQSSSSTEASSSQSSSENAVRLARKARSDVWKYFEKTSSDAKVKCVFCSKVYAYRGGTTNLRDHLLSAHPSQYRSSNYRQTTLQLPQARCSEQRDKEITRLIVKMIVKDLRPIRIVEDAGFVALLKFMEPGYTIPCRRTFTTMIISSHNTAVQSLKKRLDDADAVLLTTDIWTSLGTQAYITITAHFVSPEYHLESYVLVTKEFPERHTGLNIMEKITETAQDFEIVTKLFSIVHDQAANMELCCRLLDEENGVLSLHCTAHCLQLCLEAGLKIPSLQSLLAAAKKLVGHFHHSVVASTELKRRCSQMDIKEYKVIQMCPTRWNSSFHMLERLDYLRWPITAVLSDVTVTKTSDRHLDLKAEQWTLCKQLISTLQCFDVATTFLSYEENVSVSFVLPILNGLKDSLSSDISDTQSEELLPAIRRFREIVLHEIERRWDLSSQTLSKVLVLSSVVDPRFKMKYVATESHEDVRGLLLSEMSGVNIAKSSLPSDPSKKTALDILLGPEENSGTVTADDELAMFLAEPVAPRDTNPLVWWKKKASIYPRLAYLSKKLLCTPCTSVPSERVFSKVGLTVTKLRNSLKPKNVDALIFLNKNFTLIEN